MYNTIKIYYNIFLISKKYKGLVAPIFLFRVSEHLFYTSGINIKILQNIPKHAYANHNSISIRLQISIFLKHPV